AEPGFNSIDINPRTGLVRAGAAAKLPALVKRTAEKGLAGLEVLAGFPATVGGAIVMNAGGRYGDISACLTRVFALDRQSGPVVLERSAIAFGYRTSGLSRLIITAAEFQLIPDDPSAVRDRHMRIMEYKRTTQPLKANSAGCCFKNPTIDRILTIPDGQGGHNEFQPGSRISAGLLIDRAGCKGTRLGSATVSDHHANFITADAGGKASDVLALMDVAAGRVLDAFGVTLEPEVVIWRRSP
ncbi:MAG TPA: FAD-binding protein, partial [Phycisphaerales bacterium]|nr:FAD-binding protein [Phycisphaerales bacterium]